MAETTGSAAYDLPDRVRSYDADMEVMHPNRRHMIETTFDFLLAERDAPLLALDLGVGTAYGSATFLDRFPRAQLIAVDGARAMLDLARARLGDRAGRVTFHVCDFRTLDVLGLPPQAFDLVFSSFALHHLDASAKRVLYSQVHELLRPGGWLINADLISAESAETQRRFQQLRVEGIVRRSAGADPRFKDAASTQAFLDDLERRDGDRPLTLEADLTLLHETGFRHVSVVWVEHREAVTAGQR